MQAAFRTKTFFISLVRIDSARQAKAGRVKPHDEVAAGFHYLIVREELLVLYATGVRFEVSFVGSNPNQFAL